MKKIQRQILDFEEAHQLKSTPEMRVLDLLSELGELAKEIAKGSNYGKQKLVLNQSTWEMELGDVFYGIITLANTTNVDLDKALDLTMRKMEGRIAMKGHPGSG